MSALPVRLRERVAAETGSGLVEFVVLSAVLLVPALYLVLTLGSLQSTVFAADGLARDVARIHATDRDPARAEARADRYADLVQDDYGLAGTPSVELSCTATPCASPGGTVRATVRIPVPVPGIGPLGGTDGPVVVSSSHMITVDEHWDGR